MARRLLLLVAGLAAAYYAARFGHKIFAALPQNPANLDNLFQQITNAGDLAIYVAAAVAALGTLIASLTLVFGKLAASESRNMFVRAPGVALTMLVLVLAAFSFGVFVHPLQFGTSPLQWWYGLDSEWRAVGVVALVPTALVLVLLACEVVARLSGRYTEHLLLVEMHEQLVAMQPTLTGLANSLKEHRGNLGKWTTNVDTKLVAVDASLKEHREKDLAELKGQLAEILAKFNKTPDDDAFNELKGMIHDVGEQLTAIAERLPAKETHFLPQEVPARAAE